MLVVIPGLSSVQVESVQPVFKVAVLTLQLLVENLQISRHPVYLYVYMRAVVGLLSKVRAQPAYQQLVHFSFARSLLGGVRSLTLLLILESPPVFALFSRPGAF